MRRFSLLPIASLAGLIALALVTTKPAAAQSSGYSFDMLTDHQRGEVMRRVDSYALLETFLKACGRPPRLEARFRRTAAGCVTPQSMSILAAEFRRSLARRAGFRWDCHSAGGRRMIARSEEAIARSFADLSQVCRRG
ncbi:hypothetical protein [Phreatobacter sp.]|uniref:hypothetical protein n=1 Tax=Phreatobacter sp. TaxID=1966341 RepID=UPI0022C339EA|nr:hypothetical protein [Phreatobacter sp.]MCZ8313268.1 hypothetical protein [Phreatobacter sp.]